MVLGASFTGDRSLNSDSPNRSPVISCNSKGGKVASSQRCKPCPPAILGHSPNIQEYILSVIIILRTKDILKEKCHGMLTPNRMILL